MAQHFLSFPALKIVQIVEDNYKGEKTNTAIQYYVIISILSFYLVYSILYSIYVTWHTVSYVQYNYANLTPQHTNIFFSQSINTRHWELARSWFYIIPHIFYGIKPGLYPGYSINSTTEERAAHYDFIDNTVMHILYATDNTTLLINYAQIHYISNRQIFA